MKYVLKFICCSEYDFTDDNGKQVKGITCKCFDVETGKIVKVKTDALIPAEFGEDLEVTVKPNGNYLSYEYVA